MQSVEHLLMNKECVGSTFPGRRYFFAHSQADQTEPNKKTRPTWSVSFLPTVYNALFSTILSFPSALLEQEDEQTRSTNLLWPTSSLSYGTQTSSCRRQQTCGGTSCAQW